jgi:poly-gamma-glutamate synthesis protein (capsule biosynthesis protein)
MQRWIAVVLVTVACSAPERSAPPPSTPSIAGDPQAHDAAVAVVVPVPDAAPPDAAPARAAHLELTFMGDIMFGGMFDGKWFEKDWANNDPFAEVVPMMASDLPIANFESTVATEIPEMTGTKRFVAKPEQVALLPKNGIRVVSIANNHINDLDGDGIVSTPPFLRDAGLTIIGEPRAEEPWLRVDTVEVNGWRIGFIAATTKLNRGQKKGVPKIPFFKDPLDLKDGLLPLVKEARLDHDLVIVVMHWGVQYTDPATDWQIEAAHAWIDAGADAVVGHHPHVLQAIERYKGAVIAYSLGNFVFQNGEAVVRDTGVLRIGFDRDGACIDKVVFHPAILKRSPVHHPIPAVDKEYDEVANRLIKLSKKKPHNTEWLTEDDHLVTQGSCAP